MQNNQEKTISLKVSMKDNKKPEEAIHRRFPMNSRSFEEFEKKCKELFAIENGAPFSLGYIDEESDFILINSQLEFSEALENGKTSFILRRKAMEQVLQPLIQLRFPAELESNSSINQQNSVQAQENKVVNPIPTQVQENKNSTPTSTPSVNVQHSPSVQAQHSPMFMRHHHGSFLEKRQMKIQKKLVKLEEKQEKLIGKEEFLKEKLKKKQEKWSNKLEEKQEKWANKLEEKSNFKDDKKPFDFCKNLSRSVRIVEEPNFSNQVAPGTKFTLIWKVRNEGVVSWKDLNVAFKRGDVFGSTETFHVADEVKNGEEVVISIAFNAPIKSGRYIATYKLCFGQLMFGPPLKAFCLVPSSEKESSSSSSSSEDEKGTNKPISFGEKMQILHKLGFVNEKKNAKSLAKYEGNLDHVIQKFQKKQERKSFKKEMRHRWHI